MFEVVVLTYIIVILTKGCIEAGKRTRLARAQRVLRAYLSYYPLVEENENDILLKY